MTKYKLIKRYPGYEDLGMIAKETKGGGIMFTRTNGNISFESSTGGNYFEKQIKPYPEYWQEVKESSLLEEKVVEKDYEILSFINVNNKIYELRLDGRYFNDELKYNDYKYCLEVLKIHSVKRLSDSEIFTIGDKVFTEYVNYTINKIDIVNDKCMVTALYDTNNPNGSRFHYNLNNLKKAKQPLFTTEDGVDIFDGDTAYAVGLRDIEKDNIYPVNKKYSISDGYYKWFSTPEKAKEYTFINKSCLSLNDLLNCWDGGDGSVERYKESLLYKRFEKFVKQKLNK